MPGHITWPLLYQKFPVLQREIDLRFEFRVSKLLPKTLSITLERYDEVESFLLSYLQHEDDPVVKLRSIFIIAKTQLPMGEHLQNRKDTFRPSKGVLH
jgi:hypothetical protein